MQSRGYMGLGLVQYDTHVGFRSRQQCGCLLRDSQVSLLRFEDEDHDVHKSRQPRRNAGLADGWHVENDVIVITGLELRHQTGELSGQIASSTITVRSLGHDEKVVLDLGADGIMQSFVQPGY